MKNVCVWSFSGSNSVRMRENTDQKNSEYGHFSRSVTYVSIITTFTNLSYYGYFQKIWNHTFTEDTWKFLNSIKISNILLKLSLRYPENLFYFSFWNVSLASLNVKSSFLITCEPKQYIIVMKQLYLQIIIAKFWKIYKIPFIWLRETCSWRVEWNFYGCL